MKKKKKKKKTKSGNKKKQKKRKPKINHNLILLFPPNFFLMFPMNFNEFKRSLSLFLCKIYFILSHFFKGMGQYFQRILLIGNKFEERQKI